MKLTTAASLIAFNAIAYVGAFAPSNIASPRGFKAPIAASAPAAPSKTALNGVLRNKLVDLIVDDFLIARTKTALKGILLNKLVDVIADEKFIQDNEDLSTESKLYLGELTCAITQGLAMLGFLFIKQIEEGGKGTNEDLLTENVSLGWKKIGSKWQTTAVGQRTQKISKDWTTVILTEDDLSGEQRGFIGSEFVQTVYQVAGMLSRKQSILKIDDNDITFADAAQAGRVMSDLQYVQGEALPQTYNTDFNMQTDESFSRIFFHGIGAALMAISDEVTDPEHLKYGPFMVDMDFMSDLEMRPGDLYKKLGARVHFDDNQMVSAIYDSDLEKLFLPGDDGWEEAKMQAKVAAFTLATVREHLSQTHLIMSNNASREVVKTLHPEHPIRRLLAIFTYNAVSINRAAFEILVPEFCVIHRALPLEHEGGMKAVFNNAFTTSIAFQPFTDREIKNPKLEELASPKEGELSGFPYLSEGREFYEIAREMVREWLKEAGDEASDEYALAFYEAMKESSKGQAYELPEYSHDNMVDLISSVIFAVTAYHEIIGHVPDYTDLPNKAGFRIPKSDPTQCDIQSSILAAVIAAATSAPAPQLMAEFPNYIAADGAPEWERGVWTKFIAKMALQSKKVQADERKRAFEFMYFDPSLFECSVSV